MSSHGPTITLLGTTIEGTEESLPIEDLRFFPENPRVLAAVREITGFEELTLEEKQEQIYKRLLKEPSVKNLKPEIERDGGLQVPIIVRVETNQVIEGNSRLAVYRALAEDNRSDERWTHIRCHVFSGLTDEQQTRILSATHLQGITEWPPYAKALFCFTAVEERQVPIEAFSSLTGMGKAEIQKQVKIVKMMQENADNNYANFSYYDVLVRSRKLAPAIQDNETLRKKLLSDIKTSAFTARAMRDQLPTIMDKPRVFRKYMQGGVTLEEAYDRSKISGAEQLLKRVLTRLKEIEAPDITSLEATRARALQMHARKIEREIRRVLSGVERHLKSDGEKGIP